MWFPSFRAWCSAARLSVLAYLGIIVFPFYAWVSVLLNVLWLIAVNFQIDVLWLIFLGASIISFIVGFISYIAIKALFRLLLWILWSKPPKWLLPAKNLKVNLHKFTVLTVATLPLAMIFVLTIAAEAGIEMIADIEILKHKEFIANLIMRFFWLWFVSAAYLLHWFPIGKSETAVCS